MQIVEYSRRCDPLATFRQLRTAGLLGNDCYLHVHPDGAELGWNPAARLTLLDGRRCPEWREHVGAFAEQQAREGRSVFGYIAYDAIDRSALVLPDGTQTLRPLVALISPGEKLVFERDRVVHHTQSGRDVGAHLAGDPVVPPSPSDRPLAIVAATDPRAYVEAVRTAVGCLHDPALQKIVLSRFEAFDIGWDPVSLFATVCAPGAFVDGVLLCFGDLTAVVASPELVLAANTGRIVANPLAGTRPRGATPEADRQLREELGRDHKEIVEHVVAVKATLDDLAPLCERLAVTRLLDVQGFARVQHLSSVIEGQLRSSADMFAALWATFPVATIAGIPRSDATARIRELEGHARGLYAGMIGSAHGTERCRFALAIRGVFRYGTRTFAHAGAGIVRASDPETELQETAHKLSAVRRALSTVQS